MEYLHARQFELQVRIDVMLHFVIVAMLKWFHGHTSEFNEKFLSCRWSSSHINDFKF